MRPRDVAIGTDPFTANEWIEKSLPQFRAWINDTTWGLTQAVRDRFGENAEIAMVLGCLRKEPEVSELVEAIVIERLFHGDPALEASLGKLLYRNRKSKDDGRPYRDERHCGHCDKDTQQECFDTTHERDSSGDWQKCLECGWTKTGHGEWEPPSSG